MRKCRKCTRSQEGGAVTFVLHPFLNPSCWLLCVLCLQRLPHNVHYLTTLRKFSFAGALYLLLTWMFPLAGLMYFVAPKVS